MATQISLIQPLDLKEARRQDKVSLDRYSQRVPIWQETKTSRKHLSKAANIPATHAKQMAPWSKQLSLDHRWIWSSRNCHIRTTKKCIVSMELREQSKKSIQIKSSQLINNGNTSTSSNTTWPRRMPTMVDRTSRLGKLHKGRWSKTIRAYNWSNNKAFSHSKTSV